MTKLVLLGKYLAQYFYALCFILCVTVSYTAYSMPPKAIIATIVGKYSIITSPLIGLFFVIWFCSHKLMLLSQVTQ